jgi:hypothetical protein
MTGVVSTGVIGGIGPRQDLSGINAALDRLHVQLRKDISSEAYRAWWAPSNAFHSDNGCCLAISIDPDHEQADLAAEVIDRLPTHFEHYALYAIPWPFS